MGFILFIIAYILLFPLTFINWLTVKNKKGYFRSTALNIDRFANYEFRTLWNKILIKPNRALFGDKNRTISSVLGENIISNTLTKTGKILVWILTKEHCLNAYYSE